MRYFDLYHGAELKPAFDGTLSFDLEDLGFGAILAQPATIAAPY